MIKTLCKWFVNLHRVFLSAVRLALAYIFAIFLYPLLPFQRKFSSERGRWGSLTINWLSHFPETSFSMMMLLPFI